MARRTVRILNLERLPKKDRERAEVYAKRYRKYAREGRRDGLTKLNAVALRRTLRFRKVVAEANILLSTELQRLGLAPRVFPEERVFLLRLEDFKKVVPPDRELAGAYLGGDDVVVINQAALKHVSGVYYRKVMLHELAHAFSQTCLYLKGAGGVGRFFRVGHSMQDPEHLEMCFGSALDEAVTEKIARELVGLPFTGGVDLLNKSGGPRKGFGWTEYNYFIDVLDCAISALAFEMRTTSTLVWDRFKRGHFTGGESHLRDLDRYVGPNSRRILELAGAKRDDSGKYEEAALLRRIADYFSERISSRRKRLGKKILAKHS